MVPLLELEKITLVRSGRTVLDIEDFQLLERTRTAFMGPNGAGKSTLLLLLAGLLTPTTGAIRYRGQDLRSLNLDLWRQRTAMVLQEPVLLDRSVRRNIELGLIIRKRPAPERKRKVDEWLERLNITVLADRSARALSGGEARRVSLARALVLEPELLLLDEPFNSLDEDTTNNLINDLRRILPESGATTILVTHHREEAVALVETLCRMESGRIVSCRQLPA